MPQAAPGMQDIFVCVCVCSLHRHSDLNIFCWNLGLLQFPALHRLLGPLHSQMAQRGMSVCAVFNPHGLHYQWHSSSMPPCAISGPLLKSKLAQKKRIWNSLLIQHCFCSSTDQQLLANHTAILVFPFMLCIVLSFLAHITLPMHLPLAEPLLGCKFYVYL